MKERRKNMKRLFVFWILLSLCIFSDDACFAVDNCCGYYSPNNPFQCGPHSAGNGNCTWWCAYKRPEVSGPCLGNAVEWFNQAQEGGLPTGQIPAVGSIAVFNWWTIVDGVNTNIGHVAYVENINDDGSFDVSEMGWDSWNGVRYGYNYNEDTLDGFIGFIFPGQSQPPLFTRTITLNSPYSGDTLFGWYFSGGGDLDNDGFWDIVVSAAWANEKKGNVVAYYRQALEQKKILSLGNHNKAFFGKMCSIISDLNRNGADDILVCQAYPNRERYWGFPNCLFGCWIDTEDVYVIDGKTFSEIYKIQNPWGGTWSALPVGDVNKDGYEDFACSEGTIVDESKKVLMQMGNRVVIYSGKTGKVIKEIEAFSYSRFENPDYKTSQTWNLGGVHAYKAGDIDQDGWADIFIRSVGNFSAQPGICYIAYGPDFERRTTFLNPDGSELAWAYSWGISSSSVIGDFDNNGYADVVIANSTPESNLYLYYGPDFNQSVRLTGLDKNTNIVLESSSLSENKDINGDGHDDFVVGSNEPCGQVMLFFGPDADNPVPLIDNGLSVAGWSALIGDVNSDDKCDIAVKAVEEENVYVFLTNPERALVPTSTPTSTPTITPTSTESPTATPTITPTSRPVPTAVPTPTSVESQTGVIVCDNPNSSRDLTGQTDFDPADNRNLTIRWNAPLGSAEDWHIYARKGLGGVKYLGRTNSGSADSFNWYRNAPRLGPEFRNGPDFNSAYSFRVIRVDGSLDPDDYFDQDGFVGFNIEGGNPVLLSQPEMPNLEHGQVCIYDDILGGNDLAPMKTLGADIDKLSWRAIQIAWNFGIDPSLVNQYHVHVKVDDSDFEYLGQTGSGLITYFWWTSINEFKTASKYASGPEDSHIYQFKISLIPLQGEGSSLVSGQLMYFCE